MSEINPQHNTLSRNSPPEEAMGWVMGFVKEYRLRQFLHDNKSHHSAVEIRSFLGSKRVKRAFADQWQQQTADHWNGRSAKYAAREAVFQTMMDISLRAGLREEGALDRLGKSEKYWRNIKIKSTEVGKFLHTVVPSEVQLGH